MSDQQNNEDLKTDAAEQQATSPVGDDELVDLGAVETEQAEAAPELTVDQLQSQLAEAQQEVANLQDQALRVAAEAQNVKRRAEQEVDKARKFALEKFTGEMLPVVDSLERAIEACQSDEEAVKGLKEGVEMTLNMFVQGLGKFNVEQINPEGEAFDPALHQAMSMVDGGELAPNTVVAVMQKGYSLNGRLVRPAMVMVAK